jgi:hypothetical protein
MNAVWAELRLARAGVHRHLVMALVGVLIAAAGVWHWTAQGQARSPETRAGVVVVTVWVLGGLAIVVGSVVPGTDRATQRRNGAVLVGVAVVLPAAMLFASRPIGVLAPDYPTNPLSMEPSGNTWPLDVASVVVGAVGGVWLGLAHRRIPPRRRPPLITLGVGLAVVVPALLFVADFVSVGEPLRCWEWGDRSHAFAGGGCFAFDAGLQLATLAAIGGGVLIGLGTAQRAHEGGPEGVAPRLGGPEQAGSEARPTSARRGWLAAAVAIGCSMALIVGVVALADHLAGPSSLHPVGESGATGTLTITVNGVENPYSSAETQPSETPGKHLVRVALSIHNGGSKTAEWSSIVLSGSNLSPTPGYRDSWSDPWYVAAVPPGVTTESHVLFYAVPDDATDLVLQLKANPSATGTRFAIPSG